MRTVSAGIIMRACLSVIVSIVALASVARAQTAPGLGACCLTASAAPITPCVVTTEARCKDTAGGVWKGLNTLCDPNPCNTAPAPKGACCITGATTNAIGCVIVSEGDCKAKNGKWNGVSSVCTTACPPPPPPARGACCVPVSATNAGASACVVLSGADCKAKNGVYKGDATSCGADTCPRPTPQGACCIKLGDVIDCSLGDADSCRAKGGVYRGNGTTCSSAETCAPRGACCNVRVASSASDACVVVTKDVCAKLSGGYQGDGTLCSTANICPLPPPPSPVRGACCIGTAGRCAILTKEACDREQGTYLGDSAACSTTACPNACPCDWNHDGVLSPSDLFAFIKDYFAKRADYDNDGSTTSADLVAFVGCFTAPPDSCKSAGTGAGTTPSGATIGSTDSSR